MSILFDAPCDSLVNIYQRRKIVSYYGLNHPVRIIFCFPPVFVSWLYVCVRVGYILCQSLLVICSMFLGMPSSAKVEVYRVQKSQNPVSLPLIFRSFICFPLKSLIILYNYVTSVQVVKATELIIRSLNTNYEVIFLLFFYNWHFFHFHELLHKILCQSVNYIIRSIRLTRINSWQSSFTRWNIITYSWNVCQTSSFYFLRFIKHPNPY